MDRTEQIRLWDAIQVLIGEYTKRDIAEGLRLARESQHPDAQWLASLFPDTGRAVTTDDVLRVMEAQGDDPRALFLYGRMDAMGGSWRIPRAAALGYAPAQAVQAHRASSAADGFAWAEKASAQRDREGMYRLGDCLWSGHGCAEDRAGAIACYREAAELGHLAAMVYYGQEAFGEDEWQRYRWWGRAAVRGYTCAARFLMASASKVLTELEEGKPMGRVVFELGAAFAGHEADCTVPLLGPSTDSGSVKVVLRCVDLHDQWIAVAKAAVECWLGVGRRLSVAKDIRLLIARLLWEERREWSIVQFFWQRP